jgi:2-polyprenyl-6-methoxyphenol hydroxylase-like FAD-dependent oxidoreductase
MTAHSAPGDLLVQSPSIPVLIVGAGPTGLTLAIELARRTIPFRLIDRDARRSETSRAIGTQARTVEVFRIMGIPEAALQPAVWPRALRFAERERTLARIPFDPAPGSEPRLLSMKESDTERVLDERLAQLGGRIEQRTELTAFRIKGDRVVATVVSPDGEAQVEARFLVGADGAHSTVRRLAGIGFEGVSYPERFLLADIDIDWELSHDEGHVWIGNDDLVAVIPLPGEHRYRIIAPLPPEQATREYESEAAIAGAAETLLRQRSGVALRRIGDPVWASAFRIHRRQATRYREGPVFLAGDAAHVHSPVGGQGMNTGIQDAFNLGWKLAQAVRGIAAPGLLDTYQDERHPIARGVLLGTHLGTRLVLARNPLMEAFREYVIPTAVSVPPVRRRFLAAISQLGVGYRDSPLSVGAEEKSRWGHLRHDAGIRPGERVPDALLTDAVSGEDGSLFELISRGWTLLLFPGANPAPPRIAAVDELARLVRETVDGEVRSYAVLDTRQGPGHDSDSAVLLDPIGEATRLFSPDQGAVALIRPDGYLGYRGMVDRPGELASYLARVFAMRLREPASVTQSRPG